jgi:RNA polymerase sigma-70 factor (ECF subfamily)
MRRRPTVPIDATESSPARDQPTPEAGPDDGALATERAAAVREAIGALPPDLRTAVLLFEFEDMSHAEIAAVAGTTPKAIEVRLYRARQALRALLARWLAR